MLYFIFMFMYFLRKIFMFKLMIFLNYVFVPLGISLVVYVLTLFLQLFIFFTFSRVFWSLF